jgi:hypothetical protein
MAPDCATVPRPISIGLALLLGFLACPGHAAPEDCTENGGLATCTASIPV